MTLKYAVVEFFSNGPGESIDACVVARMKGGVSSSIGCTSDGIVMICFSRMNAISPLKRSWKACSSWSGAGMDGGQLGENLLGRFGGIDFFRDALELRLILVQIGVSDRQQLVERRVDHLVVEQLLRKRVGADAEVAIRARQQIGLQPLLVVAQRGDDGGIRLVELGDRLPGSFASVKASGTSFSKKLMMSGNCSSAISV